MSKIYGYCRISRKTQSIDRQIRNILKEYPEADIVQEAYTGTKVEGRKEFQSLLKKVQSGDTIVFDSVSRMSRNAEDGVELYMELYEKGVSLIFLKEHYIDTDIYKKNMGDRIELVGTKEDLIFRGINDYFRELAKEQIKIAFDQAEKEVKDLQQRTKEGIETARNNGKQIGQKEGKKLITKKSIEAKEKIKKYNKDFDGMLTNEETWNFIGISKMSFYKYKKELIAEESVLNEDV